MHRTYYIWIEAIVRRTENRSYFVYEIGKGEHKSFSSFFIINNSKWLKWVNKHFVKNYRLILYYDYMVSNMKGKNIIYILQIYNGNG